METTDVVFIDTSVFIAENYFNQKNRIMTLCDLAAKRRIHLVTTAITSREIEHHVITDMRQAFEKLHKDCKALRNDPTIEAYLDSHSKSQIVSFARKLYSQYLRHSQTHVIGYEYCTDTQAIFEKYFGKEKPFGEGKKKDEFPDAFALQALENYCKKTGLKEILVLTCDNDLNQYKSQYLRPLNHMAYVHQKLSEDTRFTSFETMLHDECQRLQEEIRTQVYEMLDNETLYYYRFQLAEISEIDITACDVKVNPNQYYITESTPAFIEAEILPEVTFSVDVHHQDLDYGYYDREDGCWYGEQWTTTTFDRTLDMKVLLHFDIDSDSLEIADLDLDAIEDSI
ncbi:PIN domain-containing protein [uncultured Mediterranea sp.]|uniref:PIN domain-containing protein n=1 Tax=uncultured Mediterranea sp. TaxID=1926662 RepID=UPI0027D96AA5|nr:PIN domain-containing protein [uncultured Mediterranea sp.]